MRSDYLLRGEILKNALATRGLIPKMPNRLETGDWGVGAVDIDTYIV